MQHFWEGCGLSSNPRYSQVYSHAGKPDQAREHVFSELLLGGLHTKRKVGGPRYQ